MLQWFKGEIPVRLLAQRFSIVEQPVPWLHFVDISKEGRGTRNIAHAEKIRQSLEIDLASHTRVAEERFDLRAEEKIAPNQAIVEWLFADRVPGQKQELAPIIPDCQAKHSMQASETGCAIFLVGMDNHLRVSLGAKNMTARQQFRAQGTIVPDFAVKDQPDILCFISNRLVSIHQVYNAQASETQADFVI